MTPLTGREALTTAQDGTIEPKDLTVQWHPNAHGPYNKHAENLDVVKDLSLLRELPGVNVWKDHTITASRKDFKGDKLTEAQITSLARVLFAQLIDRNVHNAHPHQYWVQMREFAKELLGSQVLQFGDELDKLFAKYSGQVECLSGCCPERKGLEMLMHMLEDDHPKPELNYHELRVRTRQELERMYKKKTKYDQGRWYNQVQQMMDRHLKIWMLGAEADVPRFARELGTEIAKLLDGKSPKVCDQTHSAIKDFMELHKDTLQNLQWKLNDHFHDSAYEYLRLGVLPHIKGTVISRAISDEFVRTKLKRAFIGREDVENLVSLYYRTKEKLPLLHWQRDQLDRTVWQKALMDKVAIKKAIHDKENDFIDRIFAEWKGSDHHFMDLLRLRMTFADLSVQRVAMVREQGNHSRIWAEGKAQRARLQVYIDRLDKKIEEARSRVVDFLVDVTPNRERGRMTDEDVGMMPKKSRLTPENIHYFISMLKEFQVLEKALPKKYKKVYSDKAIDQAMERAISLLSHKASRYRKVACVDEDGHRRVIQDRATCVEAKKCKEQHTHEKRVIRPDLYSAVAFDWWDFSPGTGS